MIVCVPVAPNDEVGHGWGRAARVAVTEVSGGELVSWDEYDVRWDELHDAGGEGSHHARIVRFLKDHAVEAVVAGHMGPPMHHTLDKLGVAVHTGAVGDARDAVLAAVG
ncbi:MAG: NifB/NifX family molybdenum-iron cluster-binding protein [Nocardioidaceae bacterium]